MTTWGLNCLSDVTREQGTSPEKETGFSLDCFYEWLSRNFLWASLLCLLVTLIFDFVPLPYFAWAAFFFCNRDFTLLVSVTVVIWAFGASLLVFFIGKIDTRCFGICFYDVLLVHAKQDSLSWKLVVFLGELFLLGCCGVYGWPITLVTVCVLQLLNIVYILLGI